MNNCGLPVYLFRFASPSVALDRPLVACRRLTKSLFGEIIFSYTRAQAIADRALIDVTATAAEAGFRFPVTVTSDLMDAIETIPQKYSHQDVQGLPVAMERKLALRK